MYGFPVFSTEITHKKAGQAGLFDWNCPSAG